MSQDKKKDILKRLSQKGLIDKVDYDSLNSIAESMDKKTTKVIDLLKKKFKMSS